MALIVWEKLILIVPPSVGHLKNESLGLVANRVMELNGHLTLSLTPTQSASGASGSITVASVRLVAVDLVIAARIELDFDQGKRVGVI